MDDTITLLTKAVKEHPSQWQRRLVLADALEETGRDEEANEQRRMAELGKNPYTRPANGTSTIPAGMDTRNKLRKKYGLKVKQNAKPVAQAVVCMYGKKPRQVDLYSASDCVPIKKRQKR